METNNIYGQDILLDDRLKPVVTSFGEQLLTEGAQTAVQQIKVRLATPYNEAKGIGLFYDHDYGSLLYKYIREEDTSANRNSIIEETINTINKDNRVDPNQTTANVHVTSDDQLMIEAYFKLYNEPDPFNLVITQTTDMKMVISDGHT